MPALEAALDRFRAADTQVLGVSVDSVHCHANWAADLGGVSFPLLADFHPKGAVAASFGHYLGKAGITDRATVIVDKSGVVRYSVSVTPSGERNVEVLLNECEMINASQSEHGNMPKGESIPTGTSMFVKSSCGHSRRALLALRNLRLDSDVIVRNVTEDTAAAKELAEIGGRDQAPCLVIGGKAVYETAEILDLLASRRAPI